MNRQPNGIIYRLGKVLISSVLLLLGIVVIRIILIVSDIRFSNNCFVGLLTLTLHCLPPPALRPQGWSCVLRHTVFGISFVLYVTWGLGKPIHVLIAFRATVFHWLCHSHQQQACILPLSVAQVIICVVWFFVTQMSTVRNGPGRQLCCENMIRERDVQFAVINWAISYFVCFSFTLLLRSIQAKLNVLSAPRHMRLLACLQYARVITKYIIVIKLNMAL